MAKDQEKSATQKHNERQDRKKRLEKRAARQKKLSNSDPWDPKPGDSVTGEIFGWQKREHPKWGVWYKVFLKDEDDNVIGLPTFHGVLQSEFNRTDTSVGDLVVIIYNGKANPDDPEGNEYHDYTVVSESEDKSDEKMPFEDPPVNQ